ncbi:Uncharacterised protein [Collinsella intestinalis]|nr:Uncharacterised protein [Collinsella intestinalis]
MEYSSGVQRTDFSSTVTVRASRLISSPLKEMIGPASSTGAACSRLPYRVYLRNCALQRATSSSGRKGLTM